MRITALIWWVAAIAASAWHPQYFADTLAARVKPSGVATVRTLPSFGRGAEALAIDEAGRVIVGSAWDASGFLHAAK